MPSAPALTPGGACVIQISTRSSGALRGLTLIVVRGGMFGRLARCVQPGAVIEAGSGPVAP